MLAPSPRQGGGPCTHQGQFQQDPSPISVKLCKDTGTGCTEGTMPCALSLVPFLSPPYKYRCCPALPPPPTWRGVGSEGFKPEIKRCSVLI